MITTVRWFILFQASWDEWDRTESGGCDSPAIHRRRRRRRWRWRWPLGEPVCEGEKIRTIHKRVVVEVVVEVHQT